MGQASLKQVSVTASTIELIVDLHTVQLLERSLHVDTSEDRGRLLHMNNLSLNLSALPIQSLHELHQGVSDELKFREQRLLSVINEGKTNNQQMFEENTQALK